MNNTNIPIDFFLIKIAEKTGWEKEDLLNSKDLGDLEIELEVKVINSFQIKSTKYNKSKNSLYRFVTNYERNQTKIFVNSIIKKHHHY